MTDKFNDRLQKAKFPPIIASDKGVAWLNGGHLWLYRNDLSDSLNGDFQSAWSSGDIVDVFSRKGTYLGSGFYNAAGQIAVRLLSNNRNETFDSAFWLRRLRYAVEYRKQLKLLNAEGACRLIYGEADGFPGLTCDRFNDVLVIEIFSLGIAKIWPELQAQLLQLLREEYSIRIRLVYEKSLGPLRAKEGLETFVGLRYCAAASADKEKELLPVGIVENGINFSVDFVNGQKTGYFLDQRENRLFLQRIAAGKNVLECFTHTGSFALNALKGGAEHVLAVDISTTALNQAKINAALNPALDSRKITWMKADVFNLLTALNEHRTGEDWDKAAALGKFDMILLDPPAFAKTREVKNSAYKGYLNINYQAMRLLPRGGYLVTTSCSHFMPEADFSKMLAEAARMADVKLKLLARKEQAPDHPILLSMPETAYLKTYFLQII